MSQEALFRDLQLIQRLNHMTPLWILEDPSTFTYAGFVPIKTASRENRACFLRVQCPKGPADLCDASYALESWAENLISYYGLDGALRKRLERAHDLAEFVAEVQDLLERCADGRAAVPRTPVPPPAPTVTGSTLLAALPDPFFYRRLCTDLKHIGRSCLRHLAMDFESVTLQAIDTGGRLHELQILDLMREQPTCIAALPWRPTAICRPASEDGRLFISIYETYRRFRSMLDELEPYFRVLDDFDAHTWVLEPEHPTYAVSSRRLNLAPQCSLVVEIDPADPCRLPNVRFFGSEQRIEAMRNRFFERRALWDSSARTPRENLQVVLMMALPPRPADMMQNAKDNECGICYTYELEGEGIPDWACDAASCGRPYHRSCLRTWLASIPETRQLFQMYHGSCPYCGEPIQVSKI
jgi:hypothetical protein